METSLYTLKQAVAITGEKTQRISYLILKGVFEPEDPSFGTGTFRQFSFQNLLEIEIAKALAPARFHILIIKSIMQTIRDEISDFFNELIETDKMPENHNILCIQTNSSTSCVNNIYEIKKIRDLLGQELLTNDLMLIQVNLDIIKNDLLHKIDECQKK